MSIPALKVRVAIPHFFREKPGGSGYGSGQPGARFARSLALARCLGALLDQARASEDLVLNIGAHRLNRAQGESQLPPIELEIHVFTTCGHRLDEVLTRFQGAIRLYDVALEDPRQLPLVVRDTLIQEGPIADLSLYLEDDLVIADPLFFDKQHWFIKATEGRAVLMPHRYEHLPRRAGVRLLVDGPLRDGFIGQFCKPQPGVARGRFQGREEIVFDRTANPHAGLFCLGRNQVEQLRSEPLPREGFIGPLETAATLTVLRTFAVLKPSLEQRRFLWVEHGHPSFQNYADRWELS